MQRNMSEYLKKQTEPNHINALIGQSFWEVNAFLKTKKTILDLYL